VHISEQYDSKQLLNLICSQTLSRCNLSCHSRLLELPVTHNSVVFTGYGVVTVRCQPALWQRDMLSFLCRFGQFCTFRSQSGNISLHVVPENRLHDVLDHVTKIFLRDEPLVQCFPPCTTGQREQEFREYATKQLRSGCSVMALDGSTVVGACLNRPLTRDEVMLSSVPPSLGPGMN